LQLLLGQASQCIPQFSWPDSGLQLIARIWLQWHTHLHRLIVGRRHDRLANLLPVQKCAHFSGQQPPHQAQQLRRQHSPQLLLVLGLVLGVRRLVIRKLLDKLHPPIGHPVFEHFG